MATGTLNGFSRYQQVHSWVCCDFVNNELPDTWKINHSQCQFHLVRKKIIARHICHGLEGMTYITYNASISSLNKTHRREFPNSPMPLNKTHRREFPNSPMVKTLPSNAGDVGSIPAWGDKIPHASGAKKPKHRQCCDKFSKDLKKKKIPRGNCITMEMVTVGKVFTTGGTKLLTKR